MQQEAGLLPEGPNTVQGCQAGPAAVTVWAVYSVTPCSACVPLLNVILVAGVLGQTPCTRPPRGGVCLGRVLSC